MAWQASTAWLRVRAVAARPRPAQRSACSASLPKAATRWRARPPAFQRTSSVNYSSRFLTKNPFDNNRLLSYLEVKPEIERVTDAGYWMRGFFSRRDREPGWLVISLQPGVLQYAHGVQKGGKPTVTRCGKRALDVSSKVAAELSKELGFERYRCSTVLPVGDYQLLLVDTPGVPPAELKTAVRWRVKDLLDYRIDEATVDFLEIPPDPAAGGRSRWTYAVAARNEAVKSCIGRFDAAAIPLSVIDIAETAQRNIASLFETAGQGD